MVWTTRVQFLAGAMTGFFPFPTASVPALGPIHSPIKWVAGALTPGVKRLGHEADHSPPSSAEFKNAWKYNSTPQYVFMEWCLTKNWKRLQGVVLS